MCQTHITHAASVHCIYRRLAQKVQLLISSPANFTCLLIHLSTHALIHCLYSTRTSLIPACLTNQTSPLIGQ